MRTEKPADESQRLCVLDSYGVMDTTPEQVYDDIAMLAARLCDAPLASVSFIGAEREWLKARHGVMADEVPRDVSFTTHALRSRKAFVVEDTRDDARFGAHPFVSGMPHVRFYAGAPIISPEGLALGAVCVYGREPRRLGDGEGDALAALAAQVAAQLESRRRLKELESVRADGEQMAHALERANHELRWAEEQLRYSQRVEAVGRLAGGIAHNFNNILAIVIMHCDLLMRELGEGHPTGWRADEIKHASQRAANLTRQLLAFGRRQILQPQLLDLNAIVSNGQLMLKHLLLGVELVIELAAGLHPVEADPGQLEQVLANLTANAAEAMSHRGTLTISTGNETFGANIVRDEAQIKPGAYARLRISDTGAGMDEETRSHIFEPFLITNSAGDGPGLNLSVVYGIVKQSGGYIFAESAPGGGGTTFNIYLPRALGAPSPDEEGQQADEAARTDAAPVATPRAVVLVVDDEPQIRMLVQQTLAEVGYGVLVAESGEAALALCRDERNHFDLMLTDVEMRRMDGWELAQHVAEVRPGVGVIFMSGHIANEDAQRGISGAETSFLHKPFSPDQLEHAVNEALGERP